MHVYCTLLKNIVLRRGFDGFSCVRDAVSFRYKQVCGLIFEFSNQLQLHRIGI